MDEVGIENKQNQRDAVCSNSLKEQSRITQTQHLIEQISHGNLFQAERMKTIVQTVTTLGNEGQKERMVKVVREEGTRRRRTTRRISYGSNEIRERERRVYG